MFLEAFDAFLAENKTKANGKKFQQGGLHGLH